MPTIRRQPACSFCRNHGHNVKNCNDVRLTDFEETCQVYMIFCNSREIFKDWLLGTYNVFDPYNKCLLRTFIIKKCNATMRTPMFYCPDLISNYMYRTYVQQNQPQMNNNNLNSPEFIQFMSDLYNNNPDYDQDVYQAFNDRNEQINGMQLAIGREMFNVFNMAYSRYLTQDQMPRNKKYNISLLLENNNNHTNNKNTDNENMDCSICLENKSNDTFVKFDCQHEFCKDCVVQCLQNNNKNVLCCALCRGNTKTFKTNCHSTYEELKILVV
jgi:hypothetical protein